MPTGCKLRIARSNRQLGGSGVSFQLAVREGTQARSHIFTHISEHAGLEIQMDLRDLRAFLPLAPLRGEGAGG